MAAQSLMGTIKFSRPHGDCWRWRLRIIQTNLDIVADSLCRLTWSCAERNMQDKQMCAAGWINAGIQHSQFTPGQFCASWYWNVYASIYNRCLSFNNQAPGAVDSLEITHFFHFSDYLKYSIWYKYSRPHLADNVSTFLKQRRLN